MFGRAVESLRLDNNKMDAGQLMQLQNVIVTLLLNQQHYTRLFICEYYLVVSFHRGSSSTFSGRYDDPFL